MTQNQQIDIKRDLLFAGIFLIWGLFVGFLLPKIYLFFYGGIEKSDLLTKVTFYSPTVAYCVVFLVALKVIRVFINKFQKGNFPTLLHDPEDSPIWNVPILKNMIANPYLLILGSLIFFSGLLYLSQVSQTAFIGQTDIPQYGFEQQVTETANLGLAVSPASEAETLELASILVSILIIVWLLNRFSKLDTIYLNLITYIGLPLAGMAYGVIMHTARYGGSDVAIYSVAIFWFISALVIVLTRSVIPAIVYHQMNNLYVKSLEMFSSDLVLTTTIISIVILGLIWIYLFFQTFQEKTNKLNTI